MSAEQIAALVSSMGSEQAKAFAAILGPILEKVSTSSALAMKKQLNRQNEDYNEISPFTYPEGELVRPKPLLRAKTFFGRVIYKDDSPRVVGIRIREDALTPLEIELFNQITEHRSARNGQWLAQVRQTGTVPELHVGVLIETQDQRMSLPSLVEILTELGTGNKVPQTSDLMQQLADMQARVLQLEAAR